MRYFLVLAMLFSLVVGSVGADQPTGHAVTDGRLGACLIRVAVPAKWNGNLLILAHGLRAEEQPPSAAVFKDGQAFAKVTGANLDTEFVAADLKRLGIKQGSHLIVRFGEKSVRVLFGVTYSDVPRGEWICFLKAEGYLKIARNYESASEALGCKAGDTISIEPEVSGDRGE